MIVMQQERKRIVLRMKEPIITVGFLLSCKITWRTISNPSREIILQRLVFMIQTSLAIVLRDF